MQYNNASGSSFRDAFDSVLGSMLQYRLDPNASVYADGMKELTQGLGDENRKQKLKFIEEAYALKKKLQDDKQATLAIEKMIAQVSE